MMLPSELHTNWAVTPLACVASVSVGFPRKFRCFGRAKIGARAKKKEGGGGEEKLTCKRLSPCFRITGTVRKAILLCACSCTVSYVLDLFSTAMGVSAFPSMDPEATFSSGSNRWCLSLHPSIPHTPST